MWRVATLVIFAISTLEAYPRVGIINGHDATSELFPHQVSLQMCEIRNSGFDPCAFSGCSGTIIDKNWVITAAQCIHDDIPLDEVYNGIEAGVEKLYREDEYRQRVHVKRYIKHPDHKSERYYDPPGPNDLALLELETPLVFTTKVQAASLPSDGSEATGAADLAGWGTPDNKWSESSKVLQWAPLTILSEEECQKQLDKALTPEKNPYVQKANICTQNNGFTSFCSGDFGSGLVQGNTLVGVTNWVSSSDCIRRDYPGVYAKVSNYIGWIRNVTGLPF